MSRPVVAILLVCTAFIAGAVWWLERPSEKVGVPENAAPASIGDGAPGARKAPTREFVASPGNSRPAEHTAGRLLVADIAATTRALNAPDSGVAQDLEILQNVIAFYRRASDGANPSGGLNEEIVDALRGKNPKRLAVLPPDHPSIDPRGQLLDRWGTPYWFHPIARDTLEIRSAGADRTLWTADDVHVGGEHVTSAQGLADRD